MGRLTISLPDELHRALKAAAANRGKTIGRLVAESLELYGVKPASSAAELVARARERAEMLEADALALAARETARHRAR